MKINNEKGFSALDIILTIVALAAIGAAVYFAIHNHNAKTAASTSPTPKATATPIPADILKIPELGIQMTLPAGLSRSDVYYVADTAQSTPTDSNGKALHDLGGVFLSTHSLVANNPYCAPKLPAQGLIFFDKSAENEQDYSFASPGTDNRAVGNFYMSIGDHQASCSSGDPALEVAQYKLFQQAFTTITPIQ